MLVYKYNIKYKIIAVPFKHHATKYTRDER
jgi:hypothetical protein